MHHAVPLEFCVPPRIEYVAVMREKISPWKSDDGVETSIPNDGDVQKIRLEW